MPSPRKVLTAYGTRPEAIKLAPFLKAMADDPLLESIAVVSGQHKHMLEPIHRVFELVPDYDLEVFDHGLSLNMLGSRVLDRLDDVLATERPDCVVVQGDTTTSAMAALAATYRGIPVVHVEAGLRSFDLASPFPEEANRRVTSHITTLHLAPTARSKSNLVSEGIDASTIHITGNTVIDALHTASSTPRPTMPTARLEELVAGGERYILLTAHRRENWGGGIRSIAAAARTLAKGHRETAIVIPAHRNPLVREVLVPLADESPNVLVTDPLDYLEFAHTLASCHLVLTDSGGVQEEAPSLGKPVLVLRDNTERPEAVEFGTVKLVGTDHDRIVDSANRLLNDPAAYSAMATATNPYGDGRATERSIAAIKALFGLGQPMADFAH